MAELSLTQLVEFLRARLDEDEQTARAAVAAPWTADSGSVFGGEPPNQGDFGEVHILPAASNEYDPDEATAAHIARHDPRRVLAEVDAKRQIIREHQKLPLRLTCKTCVSWIDNEIPERRIYPCHTLRLLALPYASHKDYREEWRP